MKISLFLVVASLLAVSADAVEFFVSPAGDDSAPGTAERPFRTPTGALDALRALRKGGKLDAKQPVEVVLQDGDYVLEKGLEFKWDDGGTFEAPVTWRAANPLRARLTTAVRVPNALFKSVTDPAVLARLPEAARGKVVQADVSSVVPEKVPEMALHFGGTPSAPLLFANHRMGVLARWPNEGFTSFTKAVDKGGVKQWRPDGGTVVTPGAFIYEDPRAQRWHFDEGVWMNGYWTHDWDNHSVKAASYGTENGTNNVIRLASEIPYGVMGGTWGRKDRRFFVFNLLDELDVPGEWYLDRARKILYWYPTNGTLTASDEVFLGFSNAPVVRVNGAKYIRFRDLVFEYGYGSALSLSGDGLWVTGCQVCGFGQCGISVWGNRNLVRGCEVQQIATAGMSVSGGDRRTLARADTVVDSNHVHDYGIYQRTYASAIDVNGCGLVIRGNVIHDAPHCAFLYGGNEHLFEYNNVYRVLMETGDAGAYYTGRDWTTMGNVLRYNYTHELGAEGELGNTMGFYFDDCDCGDEVYGNIFWKVSRGIMVGGGREHPVRNNVFADCLIGLSIDCRGMTWKHWNSLEHGGESWMLEKKALALNYTNGVWAAKYPRLAKIMQDHPREPLYDPVENNVFINCRRDLLALDGKASECMERMAPIASNLVFNTVGTNGVAHAKPDQRLTASYTIVNGTPDQPADTGFVDFAHGDFRLKPDSVLKRLCPAFTAIPVERIPTTPKPLRR